MKQMMRRLFALLMAVMMLCASLPLNAFAEIAPSAPIEEHSHGVQLMSMLGDEIEPDTSILEQDPNADDDAATYFDEVTNLYETIGPYAIWLYENGDSTQTYEEYNDNKPETVAVDNMLKFALFFDLEHGHDDDLQNAKLTLTTGPNEGDPKVVMNQRPLKVTDPNKKYAGFFCEYTVGPKDQFVELSIDGYGESSYEPISLKFDVEPTPAYTVTKTLTNVNLSVNDTDTEPKTYEYYEYNSEGDNTLKYEIEVTNTGNTDLNLDVSCALGEEGSYWTDKIDAISYDYDANPTGSCEYSYEVQSTDKVLNDITTISCGDYTAGDCDPKYLEIDTTVADHAHLTVENVEASDQPEDGYGVGDTIKYTITVTNDGNVPVEHITVTDKVQDVEDADGHAIKLEKESIDSLDPGAPDEILATIGPLTEEDILYYDGTGITTIAKAEGTAILTGSGTELVSADEADATVSTVTPDNRLYVSKTARKTEGVAVGDEITYEITVKGSDNLTVNNITVEDKLTGDKWEIDELSPKESAGTYTTKPYTVKQADVDAGEIKNTATASGFDVNDGSVDGEASVTVEIPAEPALTVENTASKTENVTLGEKITYTITVKNTGNVTVNNITVTDDNTGLNKTITSLAPGASEEYTTTHTINEDDILKGSFVNTATATGKDPSSKDVTGSDEATVTTVAKNAALTVTKTADKTTDAALNDVITYTITVKNEGNLTVNNITVTDPLTGLEKNVGTLTPGASYTEEIKTTYTVKETDIIKGQIDNTATAKGSDPNGGEVTGEGKATVNTVEKNATLTVTKTADKTTGVDLNGVITYTITVKNEGNVTVSDIAVTDPLTDLNQNIGTLAPGESAETITTTYTVQEKDILAGKIENTATATATDPDGEPVTGSDDETVTTVEQKKALTVEKTADKTSGAALGEEITYTITVKNSGNVTVSDITVTDPLTGLNQSVGTLTPDASTSVTTKHTITETDIEAGSFVNTATATGTDPKGGEVTGSDGETVTTVEKNAVLTVEKTASGTSPVGLGDTITYAITVTNSGNVTVSGITVNDDKTGASWTIEKLAPEGSEEFTTEYTVQEADILAGEIVNTATAAGTDPDGDPVTGSVTETVTGESGEPDPDDPDKPVIETPKGALTVEKTADKTEGAALNDVITYTITVTNSGNVTVSDVSVTDPKTGLNKKIESLAPGASAEVIKTTYTVQEEDILAGEIVNTATATGKDPKGGEVSGSGGETVTTVEQKKSLSVTKTADKTSGAALGEGITYTITVTNSGNVTVSDISVTDPLTSMNETIASLAPGAHVEYTTTYTVQEADILAGSFENTATATGTGPKGGEVTGSDDETVTTAAQAPALTVVKSADKTEGANLNEEITYTITVTNSGNVTVSDITVTDPKTEFEQSAGTLAPGEDASVTTKHKITEADILAGSFENTATAAGTDPNGGEVTESGDETVTMAAPAPALKVEVSASKTDHEELGERITYTITVTNSGNVTVSDITVTDPLTGLNQNIGTLAPGESAEALTTTYTVQEKDIEEGSIVNAVTAKGKDPNGKEVTGNGSSTVKTADANPELTVEKSADKASDANLNDVITYTITVTNSGNETVNSITVTDPLTELEKSVGSLPPEASTSVTTKYAITEADILAGKIENTATAAGTDPKGGQVTDSDDATVITAAPAPAWTVEKSVSGANGADGKAAVGDVLTYTIAIENTGNVTLANLKVTDTFIGNHGTRGAMNVTSDKEGAAPALAEGTLSSLAAGETVTIRYTYPVDPKDVKLENTVSVQYGEGEPVTANTETYVEEKRDFAVEKKLAKVGGTDYVSGSNVKVGDELTYAITVANKGNTVLDGLPVSDTLNGTAIDLSKATLSGSPTAKVADGKLSGVGIGETVTLSYTYTVKATDATLTNTAIVGDKSDDAKQTETTVEETPAYSASKALSLLNGSVYHSGDKVAMGDTLTYTITVVNTGNTELNDLAVSDQLNGESVNLSGAKLDKPEGSEAAFADGKLNGVGIGETVRLSYPYTVKETDTTLSNTATVGTKTDTMTTAVIDLPSIEISETITSAPANGTGYELGEAIAYDVVVTNNGNLELHGIKVTDPLTGMNEAIDRLPPGASVTLNTSHAVTEADLLGANGYASSVTELELDDAGGISTKPSSEPSKKLKNTVAVEGVASNNATVTAKASAEAPIADVTTDVGVEEIAKLNGAQIPRTAEVPVGAAIEYEITVTNNGNVTTRQTIRDVFILNGNEATKRELTLTSEGVPYDKFKAFTLSPKQSKVFTASYTVQAADRTLFNQANVAGHASSVAMTVADTPALAVEKVADAAGPVGLNDKIAYTIKATNAGNVALTDVTVSDPLTGLTQHVGDMAPGASATVTTSYVVTAADVAAGSVTNTATATGNDPNGNPMAPQSSNAVTVTALPRVTLTVNYWYDAVGGTKAAPTFNATYFAGAAYRVASPAVAGYHPSRATVAGTMPNRNVALDVIYTATSYTLTIRYVYEDGTVAATTYTDALTIGDAYTVTSPAIEGYTASEAVVAGKMPGRNVTITVIYVPEATELRTDKREASWNIGSVTMNVGECFE